MLAQIWSSTVVGVDALPVKVEVYIAASIHAHTVVGLPDHAVKESIRRVMPAIRSSGFRHPPGALTINLAPADLRKEGTHFDLPIAVAVVSAMQRSVPQDVLDGLVIIGELSLDGTVRPVRGVLPMAIRARHDQRNGLIVPEANAAEAAVVDGLRVYPVRSLAETRDFLTNRCRSIHPVPRNGLHGQPEEGRARYDFADVKGQENVKRALEVAAAGGHNVLMVGSPGAGKTMLARRLPSILPPLTGEEALETTKIHSVGGQLRGRFGLVQARPFRAPHHTISDAGLCGGGSTPLPGEISLAHNGVLFLDELPEFRRSVLEVMRQPLEEGRVVISRARVSVEYPAAFMLVAGMNPCPCGYLNDPRRACTCAPQQIQRYRARISGPLLDRIDLHLEVTPVSFDDLNRRTEAEPSARIRERVAAARAIQTARFAAHPGVYCNARMDNRLVREYCRLDEAGGRLLETAIHKLGLTARAFDRILKAARTIADLDGTAGVGAHHLSEAIQYRSLDRDGTGGYPSISVTS